MNAPSAKATVTIKKYANRRLYNTATSSYVTLENLSVMVKEGTEFNVYDAKSGEDITRSVLTQIIVEEEGKSGQQNLLPIGFLRQLIAFYGDNMQWMVPKYLEQSMQMLTQNQDQLRGYFQNTFGSMFPFGSTLEEMGKQNLAMFERAMRMFTPFTQAGADTATPTPAPSSNAPDNAEQEADEPEPAEEELDETPASQAAPAYTAAPVPTPAPVATIVRAQETRAPEPEPSSSPTTSYFSSSATPMPNVRSATANNPPPSADDMQQKIANLQRQLADLAKNRG